MYDYCNIESVDCISTKETEEDSENKIVESDVFVTKDGGLTSIIEVISKTKSYSKESVLFKVVFNFIIEAINETSKFKNIILL